MIERCENGGMANETCLKKNVPMRNLHNDCEYPLYSGKKAQSKFRSKMEELVSYRASYVLMAPFLIIFILFTVIPVVIAIFCSFTQFNMLEPPQWIGIDNYKTLFLHDSLFLKAIQNTFILAGITGPFGYFMSLALAWFVSDLGPKTRAFLTLLFYSPSLANVYFIWQLIFSGDSHGFLNAYLLKLGLISSPIQWFTDTKYLVTTTIIVILWSSMGTGFLAFVAGFQTIDRSLYEAGAVDGVKNRWQELWFITLPTMRGQMMFGAVMSITGSFGIGGTIDALCGNPSTDYKAWTIMNHLADYGGVRFEMGYACAIATLLFLLMISLNKIVQKLLAKVGE